MRTRDEERRKRTRKVKQQTGRPDARRKDDARQLGNAQRGGKESRGMTRRIHKSSPLPGPAKDVHERDVHWSELASERVQVEGGLEEI